MSVSDSDNTPTSGKCKGHKGRPCGDLMCKKSFAMSDRAKNWHPTKNGKLLPHQINLQSGIKRHFKCDKCPHDLHLEPSVIFTQDRWCQFCPGNKICKKKSCEFCKKHSFAASHRAVHWHPTRNGKLKPHQISIKFGRKVWFKCPVCPHPFEITPNQILNQSTWCPYCAIPSKMFCGEIECDFCRLRSCAMNKKMVRLWSKKNALPPHMVSLVSQKKCYFDCDKCPHTYEVSPAHNKYEGTWCQFCSKRKICGKKSCDMCKVRSCAAHPLMVECWRASNKKQPHEITLHCHDKMDFTCKDCGGDFEMCPGNIHRRGQWCPNCKYKTEKKLFKFLNIKCPDSNVTRQVREAWCCTPGTTRKLPFDYCIEKYKLIIELDGIQHFTYVKAFKNCPIKALKDDHFKTSACVKNGYTIIRILQLDVWFDKNNWQERLLGAIHKYAKPQVVLLDNEGEYDPLRKKLAEVPKKIRSRRANPRLLVEESSPSDNEERKEQDDKPTKQNISGRAKKPDRRVPDPRSKRSI